MQRVHAAPATGLSGEVPQHATAMPPNLLVEGHRFVRRHAQVVLHTVGGPSRAQPSPGRGHEPISRRGSAKRSSTMLRDNRRAGTHRLT
jgi:hypothetical protein